MRKWKFLVLGLSLGFSWNSFANTKTGKYFDHAVFVVFENTNYSDALKQPFLNQLSKTGAHFSNFMALTHPSQGNYIALTSGSLNGVTGDQNFNVNSGNVADLLEAKGLTWKVYAEAYPGKCFAGKVSGKYVRKHNPFISYINIQKNPARCANIVNADQLDKDIASGNLPNYVFYVPDINNDGHDTDAAFADKWYKQRFTPLINNPQFMTNTVLISTFDESEMGVKNQIYTSVFGPSVRAMVVSDSLNTYSLLRLIEDNWNLGNLAKQDATAIPVPNIWK